MSELKKCSKCLEEKPKTLEFFYKGKIQLRAKCKKCCSKEVMNSPNKNIVNLKYYYRNREERLDYAKGYYLKNKIIKEDTVESL
jgi:hypothetical protein